MNEEYTYKIGKYTIRVDKYRKDEIALTIAIIENNKIDFLGSCNGNNAICVDLLIRENQKLRKQLEEMKAINNVLSKELTSDKMLKQDHLITCCGIPINEIPKLAEENKKMKNQQKEFIKLLEGMYFETEDNWWFVILNKYKELIGGKEC